MGTDADSAQTATAAGTPDTFGKYSAPVYLMVRRILHVCDRKSTIFRFQSSL